MTRIQQNKSVSQSENYNVLITLSMLYMSIMLLNAILTNRYIGTNSYFLLGGAFISPFLFILDDIIAEIYGYKMIRTVIISGFLSQTLFALISLIIVNTHYPSFFKEAHAYHYILGLSFLRIDLSSFLAYIIANLINAQILTRWKMLLKGRKFWLRSMGSSILSEGIYSLIAVFMIEIFSIPTYNLLKIILIIYFIKISCTIILTTPSSILVYYLKILTKTDVYDLPNTFTPFEHKIVYDKSIHP